MLSYRLSWPKVQLSAVVVFRPTVYTREKVRKLKVLRFQLSLQWNPVYTVTTGLLK